MYKNLFKWHGNYIKGFITAACVVCVINRDNQNPSLNIVSVWYFESLISKSLQIFERKIKKWEPVTHLEVVKSKETTAKRKPKEYSTVIWSWHHGFFIETSKYQFDIVQTYSGHLIIKALPGYYYRFRKDERSVKYRSTFLKIDLTKTTSKWSITWWGD